MLTVAASLVLSLSGCGSSGSSGGGAPVLRVVSTPNPSLFPMLIAIAQNPALKVTLVPVSGSSTINSAFQNGEGDALLSMTFVAAKKSNDGVIEPMHLHSVNYWSGFHTLSYSEENITSIDDMTGKNYLISGPVGSGQNGGPDIFFQAAMKAIGYTSADFNMYYMPLNEGVTVFSGMQTLNDGEKTSGYLLVEPAATGMIMNSIAMGFNAERSVDMQVLINDARQYTLWGTGELPLGGLSVAVRIDNNSSFDTIVDSVEEAYNNAARDLMNAKNNPTELQQYATIISEGISNYYSDYNISIPAPVIVAALQNGKLVYKDNVPMQSIKSDLDNFLEFVIEETVDEAFYY